MKNEANFDFSCDPNFVYFALKSNNNLSVYKSETMSLYQVINTEGVIRSFKLEGDLVALLLEINGKTNIIKFYNLRFNYEVAKLEISINDIISFQMIQMNDLYHILIQHDSKTITYWIYQNPSFEQKNYFQPQHLPQSGIQTIPFPNFQINLPQYQVLTQSGIPQTLPSIQQNLNFIPAQIMQTNIIPPMVQPNNSYMVNPKQIKPQNVVQHMTFPHAPTYNNIYKQ